MARDIGSTADTLVGLGESVEKRLTSLLTLGRKIDHRAAELLDLGERIDTRAAEQMKGVRAVVTSADVPLNVYGHLLPSLEEQLTDGLDQLYRSTGTVDDPITATGESARTVITF